MLKLDNNKGKGEKENYSWKSIRIKREYFYIINFLKYHCILNNIDDEEIYNNIILFGIDNIKNNNIYYNFAVYSEKRLVKNFYISDQLYNEFNDFYISYSNTHHKVFKSELFELCIYLYVLNNFSDIEKHMIKFENTDFGIHTIKY